MQINVNGAGLGNPLRELFSAQAITPGEAPSYELCKTIYEFHPLGGKLAEAPIALAQSQKRKISVPKGPEDRLKEAFEDQWVKDGADEGIFNVMRLSRIYGAASIGLLVEDVAPDQQVEMWTLYKRQIAFNVWDPLNTAGSLVLNQTPNQPDFLKTTGVAVQGMAYHRSRVVVKFNERPIYLGYTSSAFGYVGRSVYQRALFPLKSFISSMVADDMILRKLGVLIMKLKAPGAIIDKLMTSLWALKRQVVKDAETDNVVSVGHEDSVESLNMQNVEGAGAFARGNILKNIATAADMPALMVENETMVSGFGEGTEDSKRIAHYIDRFRNEMLPIYMWFDEIVMYRAWNPDFYKTIQNLFPEQYGSIDYQTAFMEWKNSFKAEWPSLLIEPDSEKSKLDDIKLKAMIAVVEVLIPQLDPANKAIILQWLCDNLNELPLIFTSPLDLDFEAIAEHAEEQAQQQKDMQEQQAQGGEEGPKAPPPFAAADSLRSEELAAIRAALARINPQIARLVAGGG